MARGPSWRPTRRESVSEPHGAGPPSARGRWIAPEHSWGVESSWLAVQAPRDAFYRERTPGSFEERVTTFLGEHPNEPFTAEQIGIAIGEPGLKAPPNESDVAGIARGMRLLHLMNRLELLTEKAKIERRNIQTQRGIAKYYIARP